MARKHWVLIAVCIGFSLVTATTFTSLGYVLYSMVAELGWSQAAAGTSFALLGLACGLGSPLPAVLIRLLGSRMTLFTGALVLASGFFLASVVQGIGLFFLATALMGAGFSLIAPSPGVFLIATWFPDRPGRLMGYYFMAGSIGGVVGPLIVGGIVTLTGSWRVHWSVMGVSALLLGVLFLVAVRDAVTVESTDQVRNAAAGPAIDDQPVGWTVRRAMMTPSFVVIALAMIVVQTVVTTLHSVLVTHVAALGESGVGTAGAVAMSMLALTGTLAKGATGALAEKYEPKGLLVLGLAMQCGALLLLAATPVALLAIAAALLFGIGWGLAWLSAHILLMRYFGRSLAGDLTAAATMATTFAVLGPLSAGRVADVTGSFVPVFVVFAALLAVVVLTTAVLLRKPRAIAIDRHPQPAAAPPIDALVPAE